MENIWECAYTLDHEIVKGGSFTVIADEMQDAIDIANAYAFAVCSGNHKLVLVKRVV